MIPTNKAALRAVSPYEEATRRAQDNAVEILDKLQRLLTAADSHRKARLMLRDRILEIDRLDGVARPAVMMAESSQLRDGILEMDRRAGDARLAVMSALSSQLDTALADSLPHPTLSIEDVFGPADREAELREYERRVAAAMRIAVDLACDSEVAPPAKP